jgi:hypothetical protein
VGAGARLPPERHHPGLRAARKSLPGLDALGKLSLSVPREVCPGRGGLTGPFQGLDARARRRAPGVVKELSEGLQALRLICPGRFLEGLFQRLQGLRELCRPRR